MAVYEAKTMLSESETLEIVAALSGAGTRYDDNPNVLYVTDELAFDNGYTMALSVEDANAAEPYVTARLFNDLGEFVDGSIGGKDEFFEVWSINDSNGNTYKGQFDAAQRIKEKSSMLEITDIEWDADEEEEADLPDTMLVPNIFEAGDLDGIADYIAEQTGFCVKGYTANPVEPKPQTQSKARDGYER